MSELLLDRDDVFREGITPLELQAIAEKKSAYILEKIQSQSKNIESAKKFADEAKEYKRVWYKPFAGDSKTDKVADALVQTNAAMSGLSDLIQESVRFTCVSIQFAQVMHKTMAYMMVNGFKDSNGNQQKLAASSQEFVEEILNAAEDFVAAQLLAEKKQAEIKTRLDQKDEIDANQSRQLEELETLLVEEREINKSQEKSIKFLFDYVKTKEQFDKEQSALIEKLSGQTKYIRPILIFSIFSFVAAVSAFALTFLR